MKIRGRSLKRHFYGRVSELRGKLSRARHFRGHGVHSPFVYNIVRKVFMHSTLLPGDRVLFTALTTAGVSPHRAMQLQNLYIHCGYNSFGLNRAEGQLCVVTCDLPIGETLHLIREAAACGRTVAVMAPYDGYERLELCHQIVGEHISTTVDNCAYLLIFNNHLPKQHFQL